MCCVYGGRWVVLVTVFWMGTYYVNTEIVRKRRLFCLFLLLLLSSSSSRQVHHLFQNFKKNYFEEGVIMWRTYFWT